jgi:S-DNA-T family DNA segregation ATPase FtsK/SpoIIIE
MQNLLRRLLGRKHPSSDSGQVSSVPEEHEEISMSANEPTLHVEPVNTDKPDAGTTETEPRNLPPYDPTLDLPEYQYPSLQLLNEALKPSFSALSETSFALPIIWSVNPTGAQVRDLADLQSVLIVGVPRSGKSNLLCQFILTLLYKKHPSQLKFVLLDYKGLDLSVYQLIEKHFLARLPGQDSAVVTDTTLSVYTLNALCIEMDNRYDFLRQATVRDVVSYNNKFIQRKLDPHKGHQFLPSIILIVDNVEGFITQREKEVGMPLQRLVTMGYKAGIFVVLTTSDLHYKALPTELLHLIGERISLRLNSKEEYRKLYETGSVKISYEAGAFHYSYQGRILPGTSVYISPEFIQAVVDFISTQPGYPSAFLLPEYVDERESTGKEFDIDGIDPLFREAAQLTVQNQVGSTSLLQRRMKLGYNRAGHLMDLLEAAGIVGPNQGGKARDVLIKTERELQHHLEMLRIT